MTTKKSAKKSATKKPAAEAEIKVINRVVEALPVLEEKLQTDPKLITIHPANQSKERLEGVEELAMSIANIGLLQDPICRMKGNGFELLAGRRRFIACRDHVKMPTIPIKVVKATDAEALAVIAAENECRKQASILDLAFLMKAMCEGKEKMPYSEAGARLGMTGHKAAMVARIAMLPAKELKEIVGFDQLSYGALLLYARQPEDVRMHVLDWQFRSKVDMQRALQNVNPLISSFRFPTKEPYAGMRACGDCPFRTDADVLFVDMRDKPACLDSKCLAKKKALWQEEQVKQQGIAHFVSSEHKSSNRKIGEVTLTPITSEDVKIAKPGTPGSFKVMVGDHCAFEDETHLPGDIVTVVASGKPASKKAASGKTKTEPPATAAGAKAVWEDKMRAIWGLRWIRILSAIYNSMPRETLDRSAEDGHLIRTMRPGELNAEHWSKEWQTLGLPERVMKRLTDIPLATVLRLTLQFGQRGHAWQGARYGLDLAGKSVEDLQMYALHQLDEGMRVALHAQNGKQGSCKDRRALATWLCEIFNLPLVQMKNAAVIEKPAGKSIAKLATQAKIPLEKTGGMEFSN